MPVQTASMTHAVVIGGSLTGLLAARVLADRFTQVTVIERDRFPVEPGPRKGVPQARHAHVLLARGQRELEALFPGLDAELAAAGAPLVDWSADGAMLTRWGWTLRTQSGMVSRSCSRDLLEWLVRRRLHALPNMTLIEETDAVGLLPSADGQGVRGIAVSRRDGGAVDETHAAGDTQEILADLVVDASGRGSHAPEWLQALGYPPPQETVVNSFLGYASRWYRPPADFRPDSPRGSWKTLLFVTQPPTVSRGGVILSCEDRRWVVTLAGITRDYPPTDEAGFLAFARSLPSPLLYDAICQAEPLGPIAGYRRTENRLRHYDALTRFPERFIALGDAVCSFNPVYGQGMAAGALAAVTLDRCLAEQVSHGGLHDLIGFSRRFQKRLAPVVEQVWLLATGEDFRWPQTEGGRPTPMARFMHRYVDSVTRLATYDELAARTLIGAMHLVEPVASLLRPALLARVAAQAVAGRQPIAANAPEPNQSASVP